MCIGSDGEIGNGGRPGKESRFGLVFDITFKNFYNVTKERDVTFGDAIVATNETDTEVVYGQDGIDGSNEVGIESPKSFEIFKPTHTINAYKTYVREKLASLYYDGNATEFLLTFLDRIDEDETVRSLYNTLSFADELQSLEEHYLRLSKDISFVPFLKSLLARTGKYAEEIDRSIEDKRLLGMLHMIIANRLNDIQDPVNRTTIFDFNSYLIERQTEIAKFRDMKNNVHRNELVYEHNNELKKQIDTSIKFIKDRAKPEIENSFVAIDSNILELIGGLFKRQDKYNNISTDDIDIPDNIPGIQTPNISRIFTNNFSFSGLRTPTDLMNALVASLTGLNAASLKTPNSLNAYSFPDFIKNAALFMEEENTKKEISKHFLKQLRDIDDVVYKYSRTLISPPDEIQIITDMIDKLKSEINNQIDNLIFDPEKIHNTREELREFFISIYDKLYGMGLWDMEEVIVSALKILAVDATPNKIYEKFFARDAKRAMITDDSLVDNTAIEIEGNIVEVVEYIYDVILRNFRQVEQIVNDTIQQLMSKTSVELSISKWHVQNAIRDMGGFFRNVANDSSINEILIRSIEKLDENVATLIDLYERIFQFELMMNTTINFDGQKSPVNDALLNLRHAIQRNRILEHFEITMRTLEHHHFPISRSLLTQFKLPPELELDDIETVVQMAMERTERLIEKIRFMNLSIGKFKQLTIVRDDFKDGGRHGPFYKWRSGTFPHANFLQGNEITAETYVSWAEADVDILKLNTILIRLRAYPSAFDVNLQNVLQDFGVIMTMNSWQDYRCNKEVYRFPIGDDIVLSHSFAMNSDGHPVIANQLHEMIRFSGILSPYTTWKLQLTHPNNDFSKLNEFNQTEIAIELIGQGQYFQKSELLHDLCSKYGDTLTPSPPPNTPFPPTPPFTPATTPSTVAPETKPTPGEGQPPQTTHSTQTTQTSPRPTLYPPTQPQPGPGPDIEVLN